MYEPFVGRQESMQTMHTTVSNVNVTVSYVIDWAYSDSREEPGAEPRICDLIVKVGQHDITELLSERVLGIIEERVWEDARCDDIGHF
jgi:hypothetical protein